jgi:hypothetical protein
MTHKCKFLLTTLVIGMLGLTGASADIMVTLAPADAVIDLDVSPTTTVAILADIPQAEAILGWGLDLLLGDLGIASMSGVTIGPLFNPAFAPDGDELAGLAFPDCVFGDGVLLATVELTGNAFGLTSMALGATQGDLTEGFALCGSGFAPAVYGEGTVNVIPEPASLAMLALGILALRRR